MKLLLLGGTADGRKLAAALHQLPQVEVIYSVAGLVRQPKLDCSVISGGFSQLGGLERYVKQQQIDAILDVTHPYAAQMSSKACAAAKVCGITYWRFHRSAWQPTVGDNWQVFETVEQLPQLSQGYQRVLFTIGQLEQGLVDQLACQLAQGQGTARYIVRTAAPSKVDLPQAMDWLKAIGPFSLEDEMALMREHNVDLLVTKNSGGDSTSAKLEAARLLQIPVLIQTRPSLPSADKIFVEPQAVLDYITAIAKTAVANKIGHQ